MCLKKSSQKEPCITSQGIPRNLSQTSWKLSLGLWGVVPWRSKYQPCGHTPKLSCYLTPMLGVHPSRCTRMWGGGGVQNVRSQMKIPRGVSCPPPAIYIYLRNHNVHIPIANSTYNFGRGIGLGVDSSSERLRATRIVYMSTLRNGVEMQKSPNDWSGDVLSF